LNLQLNDFSVSVRAARRVVDARLVLFSVLTLASTCLSGCTQAAEPTKADAPAYLRLGVGLSPGQQARLAGTLVNDGLIGLGVDGRPVERIISTYEWTEDRLGLKIKLRPGLTWHNGAPVEVSQLKQTILAAMKEKPTPVSLLSITDVVLDPKQPDTATIKLSRPEAFLVVDLSTSTLKHPNDDRIGTGPYKYVASADPQSDTIQLEAFKDYFRGTPKLQRVDVRNLKQTRAALSAFMRGEVDAVHEVPPDLPAGENQRAYPFVRPYFIQLLFNTRHPALKNPVVRQALSYAVDRQAIVDQGMSKAGMVADGPIWPYHWAYSTAQKTYTHNLEAATLRLESAGLKVKPGKPGRMPSRLHIRCLTPNGPLFENIATVLQKQMYEIGIDLELIATPGDEAGRRVDLGDFETVLIQRTSGRSLSWTYSTFHSSVSAGYSSADNVLDRLRQTTNEAEIRAAVGDLQQIFHDDPPSIFIAWPKVARLVSNGFVVPDEAQREPVAKDAGRDILSSLWQWRLADRPR
jgi:peptide/nickel transport system substrate-binding protein